MTAFAVILLGWLLLFGLIAVYEIFMYGYSGPADWWRSEILRKR